MSVSEADIVWAKQHCAAIGRWYSGPDPIRTGQHLDDPAERAEANLPAWHLWSSFTRSYVMVMLASIAGHRPTVVETKIVHECAPDEAVGARKALDIFWRSGLRQRGGVRNVRHISLSGLQHRILEDDVTNRAMYRDVASLMEAHVDYTIRTRRAFLDDGLVDLDAIAADSRFILDAPRPQLLSREERNINFDGSLW